MVAVQQSFLSGVRSSLLVPHAHVVYAALLRSHGHLDHGHPDDAEHVADAVMGETLSQKSESLDRLLVRHSSDALQMKLPSLIKIL